jgi:streptogramin lyase
VLAGTLLLLTALAVGTGIVTSTGPPGADGLPPATVRVMAGTPASAVAFAAGSGWLADDHAGTVRRFDLSSGADIGRPVHIGGRPISVVSGFGRLWVADIAGSQVFEVDPTTAKVVGPPIAVAAGPVSLAAGDGGVWVASLLAGTVSVIDPRTGQVRASETLPDGAVRLVLGPGGVWVSGQTDTLTRVDPRPVGASLRSRAVSVGQGPIGVAVGAGSVWVANVKSGSVSRVDPGSMRVTATYGVGGGGGGGVPANPEMVAVWRGLVWVADGQQGVVVALDPVTGRQIGMAVAVPGVIRQLALDPGGTLWGTTANPGTVVRFSS